MKLMRLSFIADLTGAAFFGVLGLKSGVLLESLEIELEKLGSIGYYIVFGIVFIATSYLLAWIDYRKTQGEGL